MSERTEGTDRGSAPGDIAKLGRDIEGFLLALSDHFGGLRVEVQVMVDDRGAAFRVFAGFWGPWQRDFVAALEWMRSYKGTRSRQEDGK